MSCEMSDVVIRVEGLGKRYRLGGRERYYALRDVVDRAVRAPFGLIQRRNRSAGKERERPDHVWALKDVSFEVKRGEVLGVIGRNGAGKSTLLKILSRITEPTAGYAEITGRVGSLLEVGTGFHPELSGRENIYFNGAVLGMRRAEIRRKFDEIVAFADVEDFIDTPVKHYSSGMQMRLAFAVAAHLEPEILLVDEVLAVGDAEFQRRCLRKMGEVAKRGRTILFVSHSMAAITRLCDRGLLLESGHIACDGPAQRVVRTYVQSGTNSPSAHSWDHANQSPGNAIARLRSIRARGADGRTVESVDIGAPVGIEMEFEVLEEGHILIPNFHVYNGEGACLFVALEHHAAARHDPREVGRYISTAWIPGNFLAEGTLLVDAALSTLDPLQVHFWERAIIAFEVIDKFGLGMARGGYVGEMPGLMRPLLSWATEFTPNAIELPNPVGGAGVQMNDKGSSFGP
jgi:lipopolysaccharide transport system ATP-binding protein